MSGTTIGTLVGVIFGGLWGVAGASALARPTRAGTSLAALAVSLALGAAIAARGAHRAGGAFDGAVYGIAVTLEAVAIVAAAVTVRRRRPDLFAPACGFIVGLHFIGLWFATNAIVFAWTAALTCAVCLAAMLVPIPAAADPVRARLAVTGLGCALTLWTASASTLF